MNYKRIYDEFIADRLCKQPSGEDYYEIHHIIPKCMGGDDNPSNLIRLSASDHLFAHQLLARAYSKTQYAYNLWGAVLVLCKDTLEFKRMGQGGKRLGSLAVQGAAGVKLRKGIDVARKMRIDQYSGDGNPSADKTEYTFRNDDGRVVVGTRVWFCKEYGISPGSLVRLISDETNSSRDGWRIVDDSLTDDERKRRQDETKYTFANRNGATRKATRRSFKSWSCLDWQWVHAIVDYGVTTPGGWRLAV